MRLLPRVAVVLVLVGAAVLAATLSTPSLASGRQSLSLPAGGTQLQAVWLTDTPLEIRVSSLAHLSIQLSIYDSKTAGALAQGLLAKPTAVFFANGSTTFAFDPMGRGAYLLIFTSLTDEAVDFEVSQRVVGRGDTQHVVIGVTVAIGGLGLLLADGARQWRFRSIEPGAR